MLARKQLAALSKAERDRFLRKIAALTDPTIVANRRPAKAIKGSRRRKRKTGLPQIVSQTRLGDKVRFVWKRTETGILVYTIFHKNTVGQKSMF